MGTELTKDAGAPCPACGHATTVECAFLRDSSSRWACSTCGWSGPVRKAAQPAECPPKARAPTITVRVSEPGAVSRATALQVGRELGLAIQRAYKQHGGDRKITRPAVEVPPIEGAPVTGTVVWSMDLRDPRCRIASACDACANEGSCRRIGECLRYKCEFGKVDKP